MTIRRNALLSIPAIVLGLSLVPVSPAQAADALAICNPGEPYLWPAGGANIPFNPDQGDLFSGVIDNATGVALVQQSFDNWTDTGATSATYVNAGLLPVDVDITNFGPFLSPPAPDGLSAIVFDADGQIFDLLFGPGSGILGFAGPEWVNPTTCEILEGLSFLNGPTFTNLTAAEDVMTHEYGHYSNLGHVELNGQLVNFSEGGDDSGPTPDNTTFGAPSSFVGTEVIETMYPFYFGPVVGTLTPHADDIASIATLYPAPDFFANTGSISGAILAANGTTRISGVNVIARRLDGSGDDAFTDAVSTFSGAYTNNTDQSDPNVGIYTLNNLTPGAEYAVFVDTVTALAGRFSNPIAQPLPGPEEFFNGAAESGDPGTDDPLTFVGVVTAAGSPVTGVDILLNQPGEGDPLPVGDDGFVQLFLPFTYEICGQSFDAVFVNANGNLTFGAGSSDFSESAQDMLNGPPRIAGVWDDLNPSQGGSVYFTTTKNTFTVTYEEVPQFFASGSNTFSITLKKAASQAIVDYGDMDVLDGLAGVSCGLFQTGGVEPEIEINDSPNRTTHNFNGDTALYEWFSGFDNDLANYSVKYNTTKHELPDVFESNNSLGTAAAIVPPFNTAPNSQFTEISPAAGDIDWFQFDAQAGQYFVAETTRGQIDSVLGLFDAGGNLLAFNDDAFSGSNPLLSRIEGIIPADGTYFVAVTFCCDYDFDGVDPGQGLPFDEGRYVLDVQVLDGILLPLGDDTSVELGGFGFDFPFDGTDYPTIFVNSNGNITFGAPSFDFSESISEFENGPPRIAALWDDLSPNNGGLVLASSDFSTELSIEFVDVPEFFSTGANSFKITLFATGEVHIDYGDMTAVDGIAGAAEGGGASSTASDLSATGGGFVPDSPVEQFSFGNPNDLANESLTYSQ